MESNAANMKKSPGCNRSCSKPPPLRSSYLSGKLRSHLIDRPGFHPLPGLDNTNRLLSMSENPEVTETVDNICALKASSKEVTECMSGWLNFIQMLKGLCSAGAQLSQCLGAVAGESSGCGVRAAQSQAVWQHLGAAASAATATVRNQAVTALQEAHTGVDIDSDQAETNQVRGWVLGGGVVDGGVHAAQSQAVWQHLSTAASATTATVRNQAVTALQEAHTGVDIDSDQAETNQQVVCNGLMTLAHLQYQFSVACSEWLGGLAGCPCSPPHADPDTHAVTRCFTRLPPPPPLPPPQRRWSEAAAEGRVGVGTEGEGARRWSMPWKLSLPSSSGSDRSRSTTPDAIWHTALASQEELQDVIALLSMKPGPQGHHLPGVTLTRAEPSLASRCSSHRGSWWGDGEEPDVGMLASRKSSSSTDCSSCYSLHSRTSTSGSDELTHGQRSHLYSMWSGSDLPFIKLPESSEQPDT